MERIPTAKPPERAERDSGEDERQKRDRHLRVIGDRDCLPFGCGSNRAEDEQGPDVRQPITHEPEDADAPIDSDPQDARPRRRPDGRRYPDL